MKKRGYFFTLDAMLSIGILIIGTFLIFASYTKIPSRVQTGILSEGTLDVFTTTKIKDLDNPYAGLGGTLWNEGHISNPDNTLLQQIGEFYYLGKTDIAQKFIENITKNLIPPQFTIELWINESLLYPPEQTKQHNISKNTTRILLPSKKLTYGIFNKNLYGPYEVEILLWE